MSLPDFVIIGAMKCGTSTLQHQLAQQDGVFMSEPKEPNFFSDDAIYARGMSWYEGLFGGARAGELKGEASTHYTKWPTHPDAAPRMAAALPDAKLVYMVRDPVARAVSQLRHAWSMREVSGDFDEAALRMTELVHYSSYDTQLRRWLDHYPLDRFLFVSLERMNRDPDGEFARVCAFLGIRGAWVHDAEAQNEGAKRLRKFPLHKLLIDHPVSSAIRRAVVPQGVRDWVKERRQLPSFELKEETRRALADAMRDDIGAFGRRFGWNDLSPENFRERMLERQLSALQSEGT